MRFNFKKAVKAQKLLKERLNLAPLNKRINFVAGCDLTFLNPYATPTLGIGAFVVLSYPTLEVVEKVYAVMEIKIPYVPGFLAFRELPLLVKTFGKLKSKVDLVIVDGHGIAHPRGLGIASHFGLVSSVPTIGCAKKLLFGTVENLGNEKGDYAPIKNPSTGEVLGFALRTKRNVKPIYISPGNLITLKDTLKIMLEVSRNSRYRIPEPTRLAHNYLKELRRKKLEL